ncbi:MAG: DEAD/DEAH box helicase family protein, partial [Bacteroidaceae bacterium]|nr:DEAD/DEAH box helicase family protein [Bacteroidaceae bacterium]
MLQEAIDLQQYAVAELVQVTTSSKREITFRAPTGSGKTRMMSDFMNRILGNQQDVIFLVSTLSKGNLAEQNFKVFKACADKRIFPNLNPYLISSEAADEERLFIPDDYNVYVLPRDLYKETANLKKQGVLLNFLETVTSNLFGNGQNKKIYLIKDECHVATNNLDELGEFFSKVINFSATPNLRRGQLPDVTITDSDAEQAKLIKHVELDEEMKPTEVLVEEAICKFEEIKVQYRNLIGVNPCLIIQISNKEKAEEEWQKIDAILNKTEHQGLKWMSIVDKKDKCKTNDKVGKLPVARWKDYAKENSSTIDIIIFKMVISEGWDIPRACMLCQVRDAKSKQLDEQVMGRVRRNPRLVDFEKLSDEAQQLAMTAWVWGISKENVRKSYPVKLYGDGNDISTAIRLKITKLKALTKRSDFDLDQYLKQKPTLVTRTNVFELYRNLQKAENELNDLCYEYAGNDVQKWLLFNEHLSSIRNEYKTYVCDYSQSMEIVKDDNGNEKEVSFPIISNFLDLHNYVNIANWVWHRKDKQENEDGSDKFSFDSEAERDWASKLKDLSQNIESGNVGKRNPLFGQMRSDGTMEPERLIEGQKNLWGKNFPTNSEIRYEYYL